MLGVAIGGRTAAGRIRASALRIRLAAGVMVALTAVVIALGLDTRFQTALPGYTDALQARVEGKAAAELAGPTTLQNFGVAPELAGIRHWLNGPPRTLAGLRGKVVLVDFWTYSCINCLRTVPHLKAWYAAYHGHGFEIVGIHTPEFAFEHVPSNVSAATKRLGVTWPVALDNDYGTWTAFGNQYWPAEYLLDKRGRVRNVHFGEGSYGETEAMIRTLLGEQGPLAPAVPDATPDMVMTPETYLGYRRLQLYVGSPIRHDRPASYRFPHAVPENAWAYAGRWTVGKDSAIAGPGARLRLHFVAKKIFLVLGGKGSVEVLVDGRRTVTVPVTAEKLYTLRDGPHAVGTLELRFTPGVSAYAFTFG
jgi:thiol-disulfide isomerase/thioredoxin